MVDEGPPQYRREHLALQLAEEIRKDFGKPVDQAPSTRSMRTLYWIVAVVAAVIVAGLELGILNYTGRDNLPMPSAKVLALYQSDACAQRMKQILNAIDAYTFAMGRPPANLAALLPSYLPEVPLDPVSKQAYQYVRTGAGVSLVCPGPA